VRVEPDHILWAEVIYVMEDRHVSQAQEDVGALLKDKRVDQSSYAPTSTNTWMRA